MRDFGTWPYYSAACRRDVDALLKKGGSLSAYRASSAFPDWKGPAKDSWAWRLEREIEKRFGINHAIAVNSGTAALHAAIVSALPKPHDAGGEIITTPYTFSATAAAILLGGYTPVFADIDPYTFCITPETVKQRITKKTKGVLPVSLFGGMADIQGMRSLGYPVIEDACQSVGARDSHGYSGSQAVASAYSFNGGKQVPCGEGGALVTNSEKVWESSRLLVNHGENFGSHSVGYNYRINEVTACIAWHGLVELEERNRKRIQLVTDLIRFGGFDGTDALDWFGWDWPQDGSHVYYTLPLIVANDPKGRPILDRARFISRMKRRGYAVQAGYTQPLHTLPAFRKYQRCPLPVVEDVHKRLCLLNNVRPPSTVKDMQEMAKAMREALEW